MARVVVTGGTGALGTHLVPRLVKAGHQVRVLSRRARGQAADPVDVEWVEGDLATGRGLGAAVVGADVVVHAASAGRRPRQIRAVDVEGTRRLADSARIAGVPHLLYVSIVGVDRHPLPYYKVKHQAEAIVSASGVPSTIFRATQFHELIDLFVRIGSRLGPTLLPRGFVFQPVDEADVADRLVDLVAGEPLGRAPDFGGPQVRGIDDLARAWRRAWGRTDRVLTVPLPGRIARAFREGVHTCPDHAGGTVTWEQWLATHAGQRR
jgi:uncharacterized protein YbjT (DUF2867 family)